MTETLEPLEAEWLELRGLDLEVVDRAGIRTAAGGRGTSRWIGIPFFKCGELVNVKYRRIDEKDFQQSKGGEHCCWNHDCLIDPTLAEESLVITEGELDALAALQCGWLKTISVPNGAPKQAGETSSSRYDWISQIEPLVREVKEIVLATDSDGPGLALQQDLVTRLGAGRCKFVKYPLGAKDLGDVLRIHGPTAVTKCLKNAGWCVVNGLFHMDELMPVPEPVPHRIALSDLPEHYRLRLGDLTVITGVPGAGKTIFINEVCCRMAVEHGWRTVFCSFENTPQTDHRRQLRTWYNRKPPRDQTAAELETADVWINETFLFVVASYDDDPTLDWTLERFATAAIRHGVRCAVIDPWNELESQLERGQLASDYVGEALRRVRRFARKWNLHLIIAAHPNKMPKDKEGKYPVPSLYDISGSANFRNKSDVGMIVYRTLENDTIVRVEKSKHYDSIGVPGETKLRWNSYMGRFDWGEA